MNRATYVTGESIRIHDQVNSEFFGNPSKLTDLTDAYNAGNLDTEAYHSQYRELHRSYNEGGNAGGGLIGDWKVNERSSLTILSDVSKRVSDFDPTIQPTRSNINQLNAQLSTIKNSLQEYLPKIQRVENDINQFRQDRSKR